MNCMTEIKPSSPNLWCIETVKEKPRLNLSEGNFLSKFLAFFLYPFKKEITRRVTYINSELVNKALGDERSSDIDQAVNSVRAVLNVLEGCSGKDKPRGFKEAKRKCIMRLVSLEKQAKTLKRPELVKLIERQKKRIPDFSKVKLKLVNEGRIVTNLQEGPTQPLASKKAEASPATSKTQEAEKPKKPIAATAAKVKHSSFVRELRQTASAGRVFSAPATLPGSVAFRGLENVGNSCYMNSVLQTILREDFVVERLQEDLSSFATDDSEKRFVQELRNLLIALINSSKPQQKLLVDLRNLLHSQYLSQSGGRTAQHDPEELLRPLLDSLRIDLPYTRHIQAPFVDDGYTVKSDNERRSVFVVELRAEDSVSQGAANLLGRVFGSNVEDMPDWKPDFKVSDDQKIFHNRNIFASVPDYLPVHINRFIREPNQTRKNSTAIGGLFENGRPKRIPVKIETDAGEEDAHYMLTKVICHRGVGIEGGHCIAYSIDEDGSTFQYNDNQVTQMRLGNEVSKTNKGRDSVTVADEISKDGYVLFFRRVDAPNSGAPLRG